MQSRKRFMQGYATLAASTLLLLAITTLALFAAKTAVNEQRVAANEYRSKQAFEAGEAGVEFGGIHLDAENGTIVVDNDSDGYVDSYSNASTTNVAQTNGTSYSITFSNPIANDFSVIEVTAVGTSDDGSVLRTIKQLYANIPAIQTAPPAAIVTKGAVNISGNVTVTNTVNDQTIWSGGSATLGGSAETVSSTGGSDRNFTGTDISQNDATLAAKTNEEFFQTFFADTSANVKASADLYYNNSTDTNYSGLVDGQKGKVIWIDQTAGEARFTSNSTIGTEQAPVILIINGDAKMAGTLTVYGVVYITQNWSNAGGGNLNVFGSVMVAGDLSTTGTPNVTYRSDIHNKVTQTIGKYTKLPGSWRDI